MNLSRLIVVVALFVTLLGFLLDFQRRQQYEAPDQPNPGPGEMGGNFG
jgi:uncharacterized protein involved in exopolysaccharide biosynthesis